jgi:hypothetical protein
MSSSWEEHRLKRKQEILDDAKQTINAEIINEIFDDLASDYAPRGPHNWPPLRRSDGSPSNLYGSWLSRWEHQFAPYLMYSLTLVAKFYNFEKPVNASDQEEHYIRRILTNLDNYPTTLFAIDTPDAIKYAVLNKLKALALNALKTGQIEHSLEKKGKLVAVQNVLRNRTGMNASVSSGPAGLVASYLGVAPPRHSVNNSASSTRWTKNRASGANKTRTNANKNKNNKTNKK